MCACQTCVRWVGAAQSSSCSRAKASRTRPYLARTAAKRELDRPTKQDTPSRKPPKARIKKFWWIYHTELSRQEIGHTILVTHLDRLKYRKNSSDMSQNLVPKSETILTASCEKNRALLYSAKKNLEMFGNRVRFECQTKTLTYFECQTSF